MDLKPHVKKVLYTKLFFFVKSKSDQNELEGYGTVKIGKNISYRKIIEKNL